MPIVCRPPILRSGQNLADIFFYGSKIERRKLCGIIIIFTIGIGLRFMLAKGRQIEALGPPVHV